jgi:acyl transferase domain-containing protein/NADPH:quinone reductase-like Zn-dependent oxidoreductase
MSNPGGAHAPISAIKLALMAKQERAQTERILRADPIAIVGMGCRAPGGADTPERLWQQVCSGVDAIREIPVDRWNGEAWYDPDPSAPARASTKWGGFLDRIDQFDSGYFGILRREAERMDPQQRLLLEVAIEALDNAGLPHEQLQGSRTGVYIASYHNDYAQLQHNDVEDVELRTLTGTLHSIVANRLSYFLDLRSPSISIDTACSSSLVAIHLACQQLRFGEVNLAIAGGVSLMITPELMVSMSKVGFMSPTGRCRTFDSTADGFVRGEGCGVVVLKRLSDAIADNDRVLAVIRGSAVNQDGRSTLLTAPSGPAQVALIREALASAQVDPQRIGFFEAHGTGTALGDPIEVEAIAETVGKGTSHSGPCLIGSIKANIGHLEAAAGVIGLIKAVLALRNEAVPPQINFSKINPHISLNGTRLSVPTTLTPWPEGPIPRCAAVSSFGVGGTNANVILEEAPRVGSPAAGTDPDAALILPLSAQSEIALRELSQAWVRFLEESPASITDLCHTAALRRTHYDHRVAVIGRSKSELGGKLQDFLTKPTADNEIDQRRREAPRVGFVFCGQGPQWFGMGRELYAEEPAFREAVNECSELLRPLSQWSLVDELHRTEKESRLNQTEIAQPALFALDVALASLWKSWGIVPDALVGHSVGEIAALHVSGALDLAEAVRIVWHRGRVMQQATGLGRMASIGLSENEAKALIAPYGDRLSIGAVNGPRSTVLSGQTDSLEQVLETLAKRNISHRMLPVQYAFHSAQMTAFQNELASVLGDVQTAKSKIATYSTLTGSVVGDVRIDANYFSRGLREPVRFAAAMQGMLKDGCNVIVELGPQPVLASSIAECAADAQRLPTILASLRRGRPEKETMLQACAEAYGAGVTPMWKQVQASGQVVELPNYPWQRERHWIRTKTLHRGAAPSAEHPLLGRRLQVAGTDADVFESSSRDIMTWVTDHRISGRILLPAAAILEAFGAAGRAAFGHTPVVLTGFAIRRPLPIPEHTDDEAHWQIISKKVDGGIIELELYAASVINDGDSGSNWQLVANATAAVAADSSAGLQIAGSATEQIDPEAVYETYRRLGADFGPTFRCLRKIERANGYARSSIETAPALGETVSEYNLHPVFIDAGLQLCAIAAASGSEEILPDALFVPLGADRVVIHPGPHKELSANVRSVETTAATLVADVCLERPDGAPAITVQGMRFSRAEAGVASAKEDTSAVYNVAWESKHGQSNASLPMSGEWLLFVDTAGIANALANQIESAGGRCSFVRAGDQFEESSDGGWTIDPADPEHFIRLLAVAPKKLSGILHCWSISPRLGSHSSSAEMMGVGSALFLVQALAKTGTKIGSLYLVTRGAQVVNDLEDPQRLQPRSAGVWGLANVIAIEQPSLATRSIDLDPSTESNDVAQLAAELGANRDTRIALRNGKRWVPRLETYRSKAAGPKGARSNRPVQAVVAQAGTFDGVKLQPHGRRPLKPDEVRIQVSAAGLNFRDVLLTLGMYPGDGIPLGAECAGVVTETGSSVTQFAVGDRVVGFAPESLASEVAVPEAFLAPLPGSLRVEDAAGVPVAFLTAQFGLMRLAQLKRGQSVLIHSAAGGVGLAAVQLAQRQGATIFATAGSPEKRDLLRSLGIAHVMDSRTLAFADQVLEATDGKGVDVVLNSLAGEFIAASLRALAEGGCFLELGKRDILTPEAAKKARPDIRYWAYDLGAEALADRNLLRPMLDEILAAFADGSLRPLPVTIFPLDKIDDAMRFMAQARHVGKIILQISDGQNVSSAQWRCAANATYWITGGLGALGRETARWLASRGAKHLVLSGRRPPGAAAEKSISELEKLGVTIHVVEADAASGDRMRFVFDHIQNHMPPLRGVVHAAGAIKDGVLINQHWSDAAEIFGGKVDGAWLLHDLTRDLPLEFFILYSAVGVQLGAAGQGLYSAANAEIDALAWFRHRLGLPALSIAWGPWAGAGMANDLAARGRDIWQARGLEKIDPALGFACLERLLADRAVYAAVVPIDWQRFLAALPPHVDREFFGAVAPMHRPDRSPQRSKQLGVIGYLTALPLSQRKAALTAHLTEQALKTLNLSPATSIASRVPLKEFGLDSLMAVELCNSLARSGGRALPATLLFDYPTIDALTKYLTRVWEIEPEGHKPGNGEIPHTQAGLIADMSEEDAEALLLKELELNTGERTA